MVIDEVHTLVWSLGNGHKVDQGGKPAHRSGGRARRARPFKRIALVLGLTTTGAVTTPGLRGAGRRREHRYRRAMALLLVAGAILACTAPTVHDGDTLRCGADRIRLFGVDAPEVRRGAKAAEPLAYEARDLLIQLTRGRVGCRVVAQDHYGRHVARCWSSASPDINAAMIRPGLATEWRAFSKGAYEAAEDEAKAAGRGAWAPGAAPRTAR